MLFSKNKTSEAIVFIFSIFIIAICGFLYELLISTISSYFFGNSILHFSITIGFFMFSMGFGAYLSKYVENNLLKLFIIVEIAIGLIGGFSSFFLYLSFSLTQYYYIVVFLLIFIIGALVGLEIPIVTRLVKQYCSLKDALANIFAFDYLGALIASVIFPLILLPYLGVMKTSFIIGMLNLLVALVVIFDFKDQLKKYKTYFLVTIFLFITLTIGLFYSFSLVNYFEHFLYQDEVIFSKQTPYQRLIITKFNEDIRLFINGALQFSSIDEYRYHESLVHVPMSIVKNKENILILGGGDGLVAREVLKYSEVKKITLVDFDKEMTDIGKTNKIFTNINKNSLNNQKVEIINKDAYKFIENNSDLFNLIIIDLPDPNDLSLGKLYSKEFYELIKKRLSADGIVITQSTSPFFARESFWIINHTLGSVFENSKPFTVYVPSFGQWGFNMASPSNINTDLINIKVETKFLDNEYVKTLFFFDNDMSEIQTEINRLDNQVLVDSYASSWKYWN